MLLALLYDQMDCIQAAALACEHEPYGDQFWYEFYGGQLEQHGDYETAYVEVTDAELCYQLLAIATGDGFRDGRVAAEQVEQHVAQRQQIASQSTPRAA